MSTVNKLALEQRHIRILFFFAQLDSLCSNTVKCHKLWPQPQICVRLHDRYSVNIDMTKSIVLKSCKIGHLWDQGEQSNYYCAKSHYPPGNHHASHF